MTIFVSTTWHGEGRTDLDDVLARMEGLDIDGIELGSTHAFRSDLAAVIGRRVRGRIMTHNFFPPAVDDRVLNIASLDAAVRQGSLDHARVALRFAAEIGAELYTIHPGFAAEAKGAALRRDGTTAFDFRFAAGRAAPGEAMAVLRASLESLLVEAGRLGVALAVETQGSATNPGVCLLERPEEFEALDDLFDAGLGINFNLAHTTFAAGVHGFALAGFVERFAPRFRAVEISHNDGRCDSHSSIAPGSAALEWALRLWNSPLIVELRNATRAEVDASIASIRRTTAKIPRSQRA